MPNSFAPLCTRIIEVCESQFQTGTGRMIPSGSFTFNTAYPGKDEDNLGRDTLYRPTFHIDSVRLIDQNRLAENCSVAPYDLEITLQTSFGIPSSLIQSDITAMNVKILDTIHIVRRALSDPNNLNATNAGVETGLSSGMLTFVSSGTPRFNYTNGVATVDSVFSAFIWIDFV